MKLRFFLVLIYSVALCTLASCGSGPSMAGRENEIRELIYESLDIQYGHKTEDLELVYTKDFLGSIPDGFYKDALSPYMDANDDFMTTLRTADNGEFVVDVRVEDKQGGYIQIIHIVKDKTNYLIDSIEYDI